MIYQFKAEQTSARLNFNIELEKDKKVYCFIGENGVGKTQLLETMARSVLYSHSLLNNEGKYHQMFYLKDDVFDKIQDLKLFLPITFGINNNNIKQIEPKWEIITFEQVRMLNSQKIFDSPLMYIGAKNRGYAKNIDIDNLKILGDRNQRFLNAFMKGYNYMNSIEVKETSVVDWFVSRLIINPSFVYGQSDAANEAVTVCKLMQELEPEKLAGLIRPNQQGGYAINAGYSEGKFIFSGIPFEKLSTGYISIIKIFQDIIDGYASWRTDENIPINEMSGIVFIDELEAHLHPKWEQAIIPLLKKYFPNTTFYIATHSPLIVSTTEDGEAYELVKNGEFIEATKLGNPKSWYLADIYSQGFHVTNSNESEKEQEKIIKLTAEFSVVVKEHIKGINTNNKEKIESIYSELKKLLAPTDPRWGSVNNLKNLIK